MDLERELRALLVDVARRCYDRGYILATEGNLSTKIDADRILITPTGTAKARLSEDDLLVIDGEGRRLAGKGEPSGETPLHLTVYRERPDVNAVIHAHPPVATAFTVAGVDLAQRSMAEVVVTFGNIPTAPYATPQTEALARSVEGLIRHSDAVLLEKHGVVTAGRTLLEAFDRLEQVEWTAEVTLWARHLGGAETLPSEELERLFALRRARAAGR